MDTTINDIINHMDKTFDNRYRFCIMTLLKRNGESDYSSLQKLLQFSYGSLSSHLRFLENAKYIKVEKKFINRKPNTSYSLTELGEKSFTKHIKALRLLM